MQSKKETLIISMFPSINYKSARQGANCGIMKTPNKTRRKARYPIAVFKQTDFILLNYSLLLDITF